MLTVNNNKLKILIKMQKLSESFKKTFIKYML